MIDRLRKRERERERKGVKKSCWLGIKLFLLFNCDAAIADFFCYVAVPRTNLAGLESTATALLYADYITKVLDSLLSIPTHMWASANKDKLPNERQLTEYTTILQLGCPNRTSRSR